MTPEKILFHQWSLTRIVRRAIILSTAWGEVQSFQFWKERRVPKPRTVFCTFKTSCRKKKKWYGLSYLQSRNRDTDTDTEKKRHGFQGGGKRVG